MTVNYDSANEVEKIIAHLIKGVSGFQPLKECRIIARFRSGSWKVNGKTILGKAKVLSGFERYELDAELLVLVNAGAWRYLNDRQKEALVFHELCHFEALLDRHGSPKLSKEDRRPTYRLQAHDLEEFKEVVERYGFWRHDSKGFLESAQKGEQIVMELEVTPTHEKVPYLSLAK